MDIGEEKKEIILEPVEVPMGDPGTPVGPEPGHLEPVEPVTEPDREPAHAT